MARPFLFALLALAATITAQAQKALRNADKAFALARDSQKAVLLIFSGSDWCQPCIRFQEKILADTSFQRFAQQKLVLLEADFPQQKKISREEVQQNEALAEKYNPDGAFPRLLLLKPDQSVLTLVDYNNQTAPIFIGQLKQFLQKANMLKEYARSTKLMGSLFEFMVVADNTATGEQWLDDSIREVQRIETLLTEFRPGSETSLINQQAGIGPVQVSQETYQLIERSNQLATLTKGTFDITAGALKKLYNFKGETFTLPDEAVRREALRKTGYKKIRLTAPDKIFLSTEGMHISFAAIGKGYAAGKVKELLQQQGVQSGVVSAGGDLTAWGMRPNGEPWKTGIAHPDDLSRILLWLPVNGSSVATSGNYIQYFDVNGIRYSHNINPITGYPVQGIKSVTIISPAPELSDALATAVTVMGHKEGVEFINQLPQTHCIVIDDAGNIYTSKHIQIAHAA
ncbi:MAG: FAD:protein FMN transferase [Chitinophagaceae bacterium]